MTAGSRFLVLYDGVCGLCDKTVQFLLKIDRKGVLVFAPLQGPTAADVLSTQPELLQGGQDGSFKSIVVVFDADTPEKRVYLRSEGVLRIFGIVGGFWTAVSWLRIVPLFLRDAVYKWVARNRYRWFGRFDACKLPPPEWQSRFLP